MSEQTTQEGLALLRKPFPPHQISKLPKPHKKDAPKGNCTVCGGFHGLPAVHLDYVGHAALTDRLLDADPGWQWEPVAVTPEGLPRFDQTGGLWIRLTVCGVTRLGYGNAEDKSYMDAGAREKEVIGDALRNAAMRFGAALDLWHKGDLHLEPAENGNGDAPQKPAEPEGYADWFQQIAAGVTGGWSWPQLEKQWGESPEAFRVYASQNHRDAVITWKKTAQAVRVLADA